ncbi:MAG: peptidoglycan DD-metalloendopeptidase family protein [Burkholderiales bacterium]
MNLRYVSILVAVLLCGCGATPRAPVIDRTPGTIGSPAPSARPGQSQVKPGPQVAGQAGAQPVKPSAAGVDAGAETYTVRRGDTLYGIALDNGQDYRDLAEWNSLADPNVIREGQVLRLKPPVTAQSRPVVGVASPSAQPLSASADSLKSDAAKGDAIKTEPRAIRLPYSEENLALLVNPAATSKPAAAAPKPEPVKPAAQPPKPEATQISQAAPAKPEAQPVAGFDDEKVEWGWPAGGRVTAGFSDPANKGVDIAGKKGEPVFASASGKVVYIGEGLRGYGKLVIVKHNNTYLSAYAHNDTIIVKEQQSVTKGQKIAEIGSTGSDTTKLHFEIRRSGKPVDPMKFLPPRP